ncbi:penicillin-binding protein 2 [soil metagenome]
MVRAGTMQGKGDGGADRAGLRLAVLALLLTACFGALFSRLWYLQVLTTAEYRTAAKQNAVRLLYSEPVRGRILDRHGSVLVDNRQSLTVTIDRITLTNRHESQRVFKRLAKLLKMPKKEIVARARDNAVSPYKPVAIAYDVAKPDVLYLREHQDRFPGVGIDQLPVRTYPQRQEAAQVLGYTGEISADQLKLRYFARGAPRYQPGDIVGKSGVELQYDHVLRGRPAVSKVIVDAAGDVIDARAERGGRRGSDLVLAIDNGIQRLTEKALRAGLDSAHSAGYTAPAGAVAVLDPRSGAVRALASLPSYDPRLLADGISNREYDSLGARTPDNPDDDALLNRPIQTTFAPGSTFKAVTAGAALWTGIVSSYSTLPCPPVFDYRGVEFPSLVSTGSYIGFPESLQISCDSFYYQLGARLEERFGPPTSAGGDGTEKFQRYARRSGFGHDTGLDLPYENSGLVPDEKWCERLHEANDLLCPSGWLPGYTVNMSIGQGDLLVTPLQLAVAYSAIANGGKVFEPHVADRVVRTRHDGGRQVIERIKPRLAASLDLTGPEIGVIQQGLEEVVSGPGGTAAAAFAGFPTDQFPLAGKTGTAQIGESDRNNAWFVSYGPAPKPRYVIAVLVQQAGFGGESAAPVARQIWEGIAGVDNTTSNIRQGTDTTF